MDNLNSDQRSALMARIRSKDTTPELVLRRMLHRRGYRYLLHDRRLPGAPDLVFPSRRAVIFVHGCFWHGHECKIARIPKSNLDYWNNKLARNRQRDETHRRNLRRLGWRVLVVWECATRASSPTKLLNRVMRFLDKD